MHPLRSLFRSSQENQDLRKKLKEYERLLQKGTRHSHIYSGDSQKWVLTSNFDVVGISLIGSKWMEELREITDRCGQGYKLDLLDS